MLCCILQGLLLGIAYVAPIGMQNLNVISTAIQEKRGTAFQVAVITIVFDILLALACFFGVGLLIDSKLPQSLWFSKSMESRHIQSKANWGKGYQFSPKGVSDFRFHTFRK